MNWSDRFSPREYTNRPVSESDLAEIFDASRWAQSCFNEQPWRFVVATREDGAFRQRLESLLAPGNEFAREAWVLGIALGKKAFTRNNKVNLHQGFDTGAACQTLAFAAFQKGLGSRFMAGFDFERAREWASSTYEPWAMFVIGHPTDSARIPPSLEQRGRRPLSEILFRGKMI